MVEYGVREAVLVKRDGGSIWHVTFAPLHGAEGEEIMVEVSRARLEQMSFAAPYTLDEIETLGQVERT
jgi:hypothetical protein